MLISLENVTFGYENKPVHENVNMVLSEGDRAGFIGANGEGKTTLIRLISGELSPDDGRILRKTGLKTGVFAQNDGLESSRSVYDEMKDALRDVFRDREKLETAQTSLALAKDGREYASLAAECDRLEKRIAAKDGYGAEVRIATVLNGMGFSDRYGQIISTMSGGEKTRLKLCRLLLEEPELLLLDEPTNHLDTNSLFWLEDYLRSYRGTLFIVTHDRWLLDSLCTKIYELENRRVTEYRGNYSKFRILKAEQTIAAQRAYDKQQEEIAKLRDYVARNIVRATTASSAQSRVKKLERMEILEKPVPPPAPPSFSFRITMESEPSVLTVENLAVRAGEKLLFQNVSLSIRRGDKIALVGANGTGKSTLARLCAFSKNPQIRRGRFVKTGYYDQGNASLDPEETALDNLWGRHRELSQTQARALLAQAGLFEDDIGKKTKSLSGGQRAKLSLAVLEAEKANFLILDEPTNHLDLPSRESLENALAEYPGALLFVSHDRFFTERLAQKVLEAGDGQLTLYPCGYREYLDRKKKEEPVSAAVKKEDPPAARKQQNYRSRQDRAAEEKRRQRIREVETEIGRCEERESVLEKEAASPEVAADYRLFDEKWKELERVRETLTRLYEEYGTLSSE